MKIKNILLLPVILFMIIYVSGINSIHAASKKLCDITLKDSHDQKTRIPGFGEKVIIIIFSDFEARDHNKPLADLSKLYEHDNRFKGIGIINLENNPIIMSDWLVKKIIQTREDNYKTVLLFDDNLSLKKKWNLGDCDNKSVVIIIGKDREMKYLKKIRNQSESRSILNEVKKIIWREIKKAGPGSTVAAQ